MKKTNKRRLTAKERIATKPKQEPNLFDAIRKIIAPLGGVTLPDIPANLCASLLIAPTGIRIRKRSASSHASVDVWRAAV
jgi:hypothetical protein